jgi:prepilin-type N-terminal cleavage/methylation domain-containing protein
MVKIKVHMQIKTNRKGFTLLEILLVIAAIGILAAIVLIAINPNKQLAQARDTARQSDINAIQKGLDQYLIETGAYPNTLNSTSGYICNTGTEQVGGGTNCSGRIDLRVLVPNYIAAIPRDTQATGSSTGYNIVINPNNNKIAIQADLAERKSISINPYIVTSGLVLNLDAGNTASYPGTGTTWTDLSGNGNNGTIFNGATYNGANGGAIVFDGVDDYVDTGRILNTGNATTSLSLGVWVYPSSSTGNIVSMSSDKPQGSWNMPPIVATGQSFRGKIWNNNYLFATTTYTLNTWYYVVFVFDYPNRTQSLYVNSVLQNNQSLITYSSSGVDNYIYLGQSNPGADNTGMFAGRISNMHVYGNKALSILEIQQNYNALRGRYGI